MTAPCALCGPGCNQLGHARNRWPGARACAAVDTTGRGVCPFPLDPALADEAFHPSCTDDGRRALALARAAEAARQSAPARAALAAAKESAA